MKRFTGLFLILFFAAIIVSASSYASVSSIKKSFAGKVIESNVPAPFVYVSLVKFNQDNEPVFQKIIRTNAEGKFEFFDIPVSNGEDIRIGAYKEVLVSDAIVNNNSPDFEVIDIGAYANDIKGVVDNLIINPQVDFIPLDANVDNSHLVIRLAGVSTSGTGLVIRPNHPPVLDGDIGTYPNPGKPILHQNFPNPFNPQTKIIFTISEMAAVTLKVYDMSGKEVKDLVNEQKSPGNYEVLFNGQYLASGFYIYKLTAGSFTEIKKMSLIK
ncbi:hypothetical protein BH10BAC5_BH10BAC5_11760 [soil metagenome]